MFRGSGLLAFVLITFFSLLLGINALGKRTAWIGFCAMWGGIALAWSLPMFDFSTASTFNIGAWMLIISTWACLLLSVIQLFVEPMGWPDHVQWLGFMVFILWRGPGAFSLAAISR